MKHNEVMKLIDKDALVAEIESMVEKAKAERVLYPNTLLSAKDLLLLEDLEKILSLVNSLEVKEVDLEKYYHNFLQKEWFEKNCNRTMSEMMAFTARHFFELGLKVQKGE